MLCALRRRRPARPAPCEPRRWAAAREEGEEPGGERREEEGRRWRPAAGIVSWVRLGSVSGGLAASRSGLRAPRERRGAAGRAGARSPRRGRGGAGLPGSPGAFPRGDLGGFRGFPRFQRRLLLLGGRAGGSPGGAALGAQRGAALMSGGAGGLAGGVLLGLNLVALPLQHQILQPTPPAGRSCAAAVPQAVQGWALGRMRCAALPRGPAAGAPCPAASHRVPPAPSASHTPPPCCLMLCCFPKAPASWLPCGWKCFLPRFSWSVCGCWSTRRGRHPRAVTLWQNLGWLTSFLKAAKLSTGVLTLPLQQ